MPLKSYYDFLLNRALAPLCVALVLSLFGLFFALAQENPEEGSEEDYACASNLLENVPALIESYESFLNEYFKIDNPSSDQVENAMDYYRYVEDSLFAMYASGLKLEGNKTLDFASAEVTHCSALRDQYLDYARILLQKQVRASSNSKRTFEIIDGLKALNENLDDFSDDFLQTFPELFNEMNNALPCYARQCFTK